MRILVTGVAGFIGSAVADRLLREGHTVVGLDEMNGSTDPRLKRWRLAQLCGRARFAFYRVNICDRPATLDVFRAAHAHGSPPFDAVVNLAARAGVRPSVKNPWPYYDTNLAGTLNMLELCCAFEVPKFVLASSSSVYGAHNPRPFREDADTDRCLSPYAASKKAAETLCRTYHELHRLDVSVLRYFTVYGPASRPDMAPFRFVQWVAEGRPVTLYGDGAQERDFTYVDDIVDGTVAALRPLGYEIVNLGSDRPVAVRRFLQLVESALEREARVVWEPAHPADVAATWADIRKARSLLGWEPRTSLEDGVARLVAWYRAQREWAKEIETS